MEIVVVLLCLLILTDNVVGKKLAFNLLARSDND